MEGEDLLEDLISLEYQGKPLELGRMDSYDVAANIIAFSDYLGVISKSAYGERVSIKTEIQGFRNESFDIDFAIQIGGVVATLLSGPVSSPKDLIELIKETFSAWRHLKGKPPQSMNRTDNNQDVIQIENQNGELIYVKSDVINIITDARAAKAAEQFIRKPLESGVEKLKIVSRECKEIVEVPKNEASSFGLIDIDTPLLESESTIGLVIESPTFKEGNKWKFFDGQNSFHAEVTDEKFLSKVNEGVERFGKGDILIVKKRTTQVSSLETLKIERTILEVIEHKMGSKQQPLL